jgi:hypothetical protein
MNVRTRSTWRRAMADDRLVAGGCAFATPAARAAATVKAWATRFAEAALEGRSDMQATLAEQRPR